MVNFEYKFIGAPEVVIFPINNEDEDEEEKDDENDGGICIYGCEKYAFAIEYIYGIDKSGNISTDHTDELRNFLKFYYTNLKNVDRDILFDKNREKSYCVEADKDDLKRVPGATNRFPWEEVHWWEETEPEEQDGSSRFNYVGFLHHMFDF